MGVVSNVNCVSAFAESTKNINSDVLAEATKATNLSQEEKEQLKEWMSEYGVNEFTQDILIAKLENGQAWDSINGSSPIKTEKLDEYSVKETYKDGSIAISGVEDINKDYELEGNLDSEISLFSLSGGTVSSGSGYMNVKEKKVYKYTAIINAHFYADYTFVKGGKSYISKVYNKRVVGIGCSISNIELRIDKKNQDANGPAEAVLEFITTSINGWAGGNCYLKLIVGNDATSEYMF